MHVRKMFNHPIGWFVAVAAVTAFSLAVVMAAGAPVQAGDDSRPVQVVHPQHQVFNDNLVVESGETYDGDVVVYNGDVKVEDGGRIAGSMIWSAARLPASSRIDTRSYSAPKLRQNRPISKRARPDAASAGTTKSR